MKGSSFTRLVIGLALPLAIWICASASNTVAAPFFTENFEELHRDQLDSNGGGSNTGTNHWFGPFSPNLQVVGPENGVTPYEGTNMVRGDPTFGMSQDFYNIAFRLNNSKVYTGDLMLDWWFYDPAGTNASSGSTNGAADFRDTIGLADYAGFPVTADYTDPNVPGTLFQDVALGGSFDQAPGYDPAKYQAFVLGSTNGYHSGWINTTTTRGIGWHHGRIIVPPKDTNSMISVAFYMDDMDIATASGTTTVSPGFNSIEMDGYFGRATAYYDKLSLSRAPPPEIKLSLIGSDAVLKWPPGYYLQSTTNLANTAFSDVPGATSPYTNSVTSSPQAFFRLRN